MFSSHGRPPAQETEVNCRLGVTGLEGLVTRELVVTPATGFFIFLSSNNNFEPQVQALVGQLLLMVDERKDKKPAVRPSGWGNLSFPFPFTRFRAATTNK